MQGTVENTDRQLLASFVADQDEGAFRELVTRHGPGVLRVCRYVLHNHVEADDAFQATFLTLVHRAATIRDPENLGNWLRGVAYKVASRSRRRLARRSEHERTRAMMMPANDVLPNDPVHDLNQILRDELDQLPEQYRAPLYLCYLEDLSHQEAAEHLGWPTGTVKVRLVRGRKLLRERLDRRGISLSLALMLLFWKREANAAIPEELVNCTVSSMMKQLDSRQAVGLFSSIPQSFTDSSRFGRLFSRRWILLIVLAASLMIGISGQMVFARQSFRPLVDRSFLPANLTDVLNIQCR